MKNIFLSERSLEQPKYSNLSVTKTISIKLLNNLGLSIIIPKPINESIKSKVKEILKNLALENKKITKILEKINDIHQLQAEYKEIEQSVFNIKTLSKTLSSNVSEYLNNKEFENFIKDYVSNVYGKVGIERLIDEYINNNFDYTNYIDNLDNLDNSKFSSQTTIQYITTILNFSMPRQWIIEKNYLLTGKIIDENGNLGNLEIVWDPEHKCGGCRNDSRSLADHTCIKKTDIIHLKDFNIDGNRLFQLMMNEKKEQTQKHGEYITSLHNNQLKDFGI